MQFGPVDHTVCLAHSHCAFASVTPAFIVLSAGAMSRCFSRSAVSFDVSRDVRVILCIMQMHAIPECDLDAGLCQCNLLRSVVCSSEQLCP